MTNQNKQTTSQGEFAKTFPEEFRQRVISIDLRKLSRVRDEDQDDVNFLKILWQNFLEKEYDPACGRCFDEMIKDFRSLQRSFIDLDGKEKRNMMLAKLIPEIERREILELNLIEQAKALATDGTMDYLCMIWQKAIDPHFSKDSDHGLTMVLKTLKEIKPALLQLELEA